MVGLLDAQGELQRSKDRVAERWRQSHGDHIRSRLKHLGQLEKALGSIAATAEGPLAVAL